MPIGQGNEFLAAIGANTDHDQQHLVLSQPDFQVDPVGLDVDEITVSEGPFVERLGLTLPLGRGRVITDGDNPAPVPRNCSNAGVKSDVDRPCS